MNGRTALKVMAGVWTWVFLMAVTAGVEAQTLRLSFLVDRPMLWPEQVQLKNELSDGVSSWSAGTVLSVHSVQRDGVVVRSPQGEDLALLPAEATDLLERAGGIRQQLPADIRDLVLRQLVERHELLPVRIQLTEPLQMPGPKQYPVGKVLVPIRLELSGQEVQLVAVDPETLSEGVLKERFHYPVASTDLIQRMRRQILAAEKPVMRVTEELADRLVDADGKPVTEPEVAPRYYVVFYGAGSCGWCTRLAPALEKFYREVIKPRDDVQMVLLSRDESREQMFAYMKRDAMSWPAIAFDRRSEVPLLQGLTQGGTPHLFVMRADGKIVHDGQPAGQRGVELAMAAFRRELARSGS